MKIKKYLKAATAFTLSASLALSGFVTSDAASRYKLNNQVSKYTTADSASKKTGAVGSYASGDYYIYKSANGMLNISKVAGAAGAWINPNDNKSPVTSVKTPVSSTTTTSSKTSEYKLYNTVSVYGNAADAKVRKSKISSYSAGTYYIYKSYNGMLNISKRSGSAGGWINPADNKIPTNQTSPVVSNPVNTSPTKTATGNTRTNTSFSNLKAGSKYKLNNSVATYANAGYAKTGYKRVSTYSAGEYFIYKLYNGMLNISKKYGLPGAWINPADNKIATVISVKPSVPVVTEPVKPTEPVVTKPTKPVETIDEKEVVEEKIEETVVVEVGSQYNLIDVVAVYGNAADALNRANKVSEYQPGQYYIYKIYNGMFNISKTVGKPGAWINPKDLSETVTTKVPTESTEAKIELAIESNLARGTYYKVFTDIDGYVTATDALNKTAAMTTLKQGIYRIYSTSNNMLNITSDINTAGSWINPNTNVGITSVDNGLTPEQFIEKVGPIAQAATADRDLYASIMIAQTILETGYGKSYLSDENFNNYFGIKGSYNGEAVAVHTSEYTADGQRYRVIAPFRKYDSATSSFKDYVNFLTGNEDPNSFRYKYYYGARRSVAKSYQNAANYLSGKYATSPVYGEKLIDLIQRYNLTRFDAK